MKVYFYLVLAFMMVSRSEMLSQTTSTLILPNKINGKVQLDISTIFNRNVEKWGYEHLSVFVENEHAEYGSKAIQGRYAVENEYLVFRPYFPFEKGMTYVVKIKNLDGNHSFQSFQVGEKEPFAKAAVTSIYPTAHELPENLLRFYFYFNTPMKKGQALKHIQLIDAEGNVDNHAFMEFKQELWSGDGKRLTILFDPGRIKRGVSTNLELGPALLAGNKYTLKISGKWLDVYGQELAVETTKEFIAVEAYRQLIKVDGLEIQQPETNSHASLSIHFARIIDHALVHSMIRIVDENERLIAGHWETLEEEKTIQFIPENPWKKGLYRILMDSRLEDVTGNNLNNLLDQRTDKENSDIQHLIRSFTI